MQRIELQKCSDDMISIQRVWTFKALRLKCFVGTVLLVSEAFHILYIIHTTQSSLCKGKD